jgi:TonB-linked SusC/RagA family outer membrane protein
MKFFVPANALGMRMPAKLLLMNPGKLRFGLAIKKQVVMQIKLTTAFLLMAVIHVSANTFSQNVTLSVKQASLKQVFKLISDQTGYAFIINPSLLDSAAPVTITEREVSLTSALQKITKEQGLTYAIKYKTIVVTKAGTTSAVVMNGGDAVAITFAATPPGDLRGKVVDKEGKPVVNAFIKVKSESIYTKAAFTNERGEFTLSGIDLYATLLVSSVNIESAEIELKGGTTITISVKNKVEVLGAFTILNTGFQTLTKERATGSFGKPDMQIFSERTGTMDIIGRLEGQVAGLQISGDASSYNANLNGNGVTTKKSLVRGVTSPRLGTEPLYVVNGVIVAEFSAVNPDDIEDITVLKDAAAAAIWGARAANGVLVITTKSGSKSQRASISYTGFFNYNGRPDFSYGKLMNSPQFIQAAKEIFDDAVYPWSSVNSYGLAPHEQIQYDRSRGLISEAVANQKLDSLASINNMDQMSQLFYRPTFTNNHTISASGGNSLYSFYASLGYTGSQSATPGERNNSYKLNLTQSITAGSRLKVTLSAAVINTVHSNKNYPSMSASFLPYQLFRDAAGNNIKMNYLTGYSDSLRQDYQDRSRINLEYSPLDEVDLGYGEANNLNINVTANISVKLWKGLSFVGTYGYQKAPGTAIYYNDNKMLSQRQQIVSLTEAPDVNSTPIYNLPVNGGHYQTGNNDQRNWTVRNQLAYDGTFSQGRDHLTLQAGNDVQEGYNLRSSSTLIGYDEALGTYAVLDYARLRNGIPGTVTGWGSLYFTPYNINKDYTRFLSYFGLASYSINGKYSVDASIRQDYSNQFGKDLSSQSKPSCSFGAKWLLAREKFMEPVKWINDLAIRVTHGITGNSPYVGAASRDNIFYAINNSNNSSAIAGDALALSSVANNALSWEITHTTNAGIDFAVLNRRISGGIDLYYKSSTDLIGSVQVNPWTGLGSLTGNIGQLVNKGVELSLRSENIRTKDFNWSTSFNISYNYNKLVSYSKPDAWSNTASAKIYGGASLVGYNTSAMFAYQFAGLDNMGDPQIYQANKTVTKNPNIAQPEDVVYMGNTRPPVYGGLSNSFTYKGFRLSLNAIYNLGAVMRRDVNTFYAGRLQTSTSFGGPNIQTNFMDRWKKPGDEAFTNVPSYVSSYSVNYSRRNVDYYTRGDINVVSASYLKLRDVTLAYDLPANALQFLKIQHANVFMQVTNFLLWAANDDGIDPELMRYAGAGNPGHSYSIGVNLSF